MSGVSCNTGHTLTHSLKVPWIDCLVSGQQNTLQGNSTHNHWSVGIVTHMILMISRYWRCKDEAKAAEPNFPKLRVRLCNCDVNSGSSTDYCSCGNDPSEVWLKWVTARFDSSSCNTRTHTHTHWRTSSLYQHQRIQRAKHPLKSSQK